MAHSLAAVREAAIDGRMNNIITRRTQLEALQRALLDQADAIEAAIRHDTGHSGSEAAVEYLVTVRALKECHQSLGVERALRDEGAIARGEDAAGRRDPVGIVYISAANYTVFNSVLVAVASALAAGNCVVIELPNTLRAVPALIRNIVESSLDRSTVAFVTSPATDDDLGPHHIRLRQDTGTAELVVVAVVDRTADLAGAAEALVAARFSFGGRSPYAPDVVLVNEFVREPFLSALVQAAMAFRPTLGLLDAAGVPQGARFESDHGEGVRLVSSTRRGAILETLGQLYACYFSRCVVIVGVTDAYNGSRNPKSLASKTAGCRLLVHSVRSLDGAIDQSNRTGKLAGAYVFADARSAKYLTQFIASPVSFVNHVPVDVLVGPPAPSNTAFNRSLRYPTSIFSVPRPLYANPTPLSLSMDEVLRDGSAAPLRRALGRQKTELVLTTERSLGRGVGFFEQGILTGLGLFSATMLAGVCSLGYWAWIAVIGHRS